MQTSIQESRDFLTLLYGEASGFVPIWTPDRRTQWFPVAEIDAAARYAVEQAQDVYFGVGLHPEPRGEYARGSAKDVQALPGLWVDIDVAGPGHAAKNLPPTSGDALEMLNSLPLQPTVVVWSGGGVHVYWLFREPWKLDTPEENAQAGRMAERLQAWVREQAAGRGWHLDNTADLARVLRVPGTMNRKGDPVPVAVVFDDGPRYSPADFDNLLPAVGVGDVTRSRETKPFIPTGAGDYRTLDVVSWLESHGLYRRPAGESGMHYIRCPWEDEHTPDGRGEGDTSTAAFEADGEHWPGWRCFHKCDGNRTFSDIIAKLGDADRFCTREFGKEERPTSTTLDVKPTIRSAADLSNQAFEPIKWAIPEYIQQGVTLLAGASKAGKSWWALQAAVAIASGKKFLGKIEVEQGDVLYLALEEEEETLQDLLFDICQSSSFPERLHYTTECPVFLDEGIDFVSSWLEKHREARLVVIDVLQRIRPPRGSRGDLYGDDYNAMVIIKDLAKRFKVPLLVLHHANKVKEKDLGDWQDKISGTMGLTAVPDTLMLLQLEKDSKVLASLRIRGRRIPNDTKTLIRGEYGCWVLEETEEEQALSDTRKDIVRVMEERGLETPLEVATALDKNVNTIGVLMRRMAKVYQLRKIAYGRYSTPHLSFCNDRNECNVLSLARHEMEPEDDETVTSCVTSGDLGEAVTAVTVVTPSGVPPVDETEDAGYWSSLFGIAEKDETDGKQTQ